MRLVISALAFMLACAASAAAQEGNLNVTHDTTGDVSDAGRTALAAFTDALEAKDNVRAGAAMVDLYASVIDEPRTGLRLERSGLAARLAEDLEPFRTIPGTAEGGQWGFRVTADWLPAEDAMVVPTNGNQCGTLLAKENDEVNSRVHSVLAASGGPATTLCGISGDAPDSFWHQLTLQPGSNGGQLMLQIIFNSRSAAERDAIAPYLQRALVDLANAVRVRN